MHFLLQKMVSQRKNASEPRRFPSVIKVWVIRLGFVLIIPLTFEDQTQRFPHEQCCMVSQYSRSLIGKHDSSIFDLDPEVVKFTRHKSVRVGISEEVSLIVRPETKLIYQRVLTTVRGVAYGNMVCRVFKRGIQN